MITTRGWLRATTALLGLSVVLVPAAAPAAAAAAPASAHHRVMPEPPPADDVRAELDQLTIDTPHPMTGYSRAKFPHWIRQYGTCDTREVVLGRDGASVTQDSECRATVHR